MLALTAPRVGPGARAAEEAIGADTSAAMTSNSNDNGILREALRLRVRWIQELSGRAAWELGERLTAAGDFADPELIRHMTLDHVEAVATNRAVVVRCAVRDHHHDFGSAVAGVVPDVRPGQADPGAVRQRGGRRHGCRWRLGDRVVTYDSVDPPDRIGSRDDDAVTRTSGPRCRRLTRHRGRDRIGAVAPRDPRS